MGGLQKVVGNCGLINMVRFEFQWQEFNDRWKLTFYLIGIGVMR